MFLDLSWHKLPRHEATYRKSLPPKRGRRDSNPQPPDRQNELQDFRTSLFFRHFLTFLPTLQRHSTLRSLRSLYEFVLPCGLKKVHSCEFTNQRYLRRSFKIQVSRRRKIQRMPARGEARKT